MTTVNPNSALHWLDAAQEATEALDVETPTTTVVEFDFFESAPLLEGETPEQFPDGELAAAACEIGWPVFLRTDLTSAKHDGINAVRATNKDEILPVASNLVRDAAQKMMRPAAFLVRDWVQIDHEFTAFDGLPIGTEIRLFAGPDEVLCSHYYWPEESIENPDTSDWKQIRDEYATVSPPPELRVAATLAATRANRHAKIDDLAVWSLDFAHSVDGTWYLLDMALAADSWHPECSNHDPEAQT